MPIIQCNQCQRGLKVTDAMQGKLVRCPTCQKTMRVPAASAVEPPILEEAEPLSQEPRDADSDLIEPAKPPRKKSSNRDDEVLDELPRKKSRRRDDHEDFEEPRKRRRFDDDDELPRRRRRKSTSSAVLLTVGLTVMLLLGAVGTGAFLLVRQVLREQENLNDKDWVSFVGPDKRYSLLMPGVPTTQTQAVAGSNVPMKIHVLDLKHKAFFASHFDIPLEDMPNMPPDQRLMKSRDGMMEKVPGSVLESDKPILLEKHPGREIVFRVPKQGLTVARIFLVENRLYILMVMGGSVAADSPAVVKFMQSFKLLELPVAVTDIDLQNGSFRLDGNLAESDGKDAVRKNSPCKLYAIKMVPGRGYRIDAASKQLETFLRLECPPGVGGVSTYDAGGSGRARIDYTCPKSGTYRIGVSTFNPRFGAFTLSITEFPGPPPAK